MSTPTATTMSSSVPTTTYVDEDGDGFRPDATTVVTGSVACTGAGEASFTVPDGDCADTDPVYNPGADEPDCTDPNDYDCDGRTEYADADGDGWVACEDCDDADAAVNPDGIERVDDGVDSDCDGGELCLVDEDHDGYRADGDATVASGDEDCEDRGEATVDTPAADCDDTDAAYHPGADESDCDDPTDYNCDGATGLADGDGDSFPACADCDDTRADVNADVAEICNGTDDNCDGFVDNSPTDATTWHADADGDGFTDPITRVVGCEAPEGYTMPTEEDCDDTSAAVYPGAPDVTRDGIDQDCDGVDATEGDTGSAPPPEDSTACGCANAGGGGAGVLPLVLALMCVGRRRAAATTREPSSAVAPMSPSRLLLPLFALVLLGADPRPPEGTAGTWACVDSVDNDRDLLFDCLDPGCTGDMSCAPHLTVRGLNDGETRALGHYSRVTAYVQAGDMRLPHDVIWTSEDPTVLVVTQGVLQPRAKGTTRLTASAGGFTETFVVSVADREAPPPGWGSNVGEIGGLIGTKGSPIGSDGGTNAATEARPTTSPPSAGSPILLGRLELSLVHAGIKARDAEIRGCYGRALTRHPTLAGTVWVKFVVAADGRVTSALTKSTTLKDAALEACVNAEVLRCRFGEPGGEVIVSYPFAFAPHATAYPEPRPLPPADGEYEGDDSAECLDDTDDDQDGAVDCLDAGCVGSPRCRPSLYVPALEVGTQLHTGVALRPKVEAFVGPARLATLPPLTWSSSDTAVVTVVDGTLVALARGTAIVTVSSGPMSWSGWVEVVGSADSATAGLIGIEAPAPTPGEPETARASGGTRAMEFGEPVILGALDRSSLESVLQRNATSLSLCYERALKTNPALAGTVVIKFVIAKDGTISSRTTKRSTLGDASVESCIHGWFDRMKFPEPPGGGIVIASYPLIFAPPANVPASTAK
jgi:hypothetical protein